MGKFFILILGIILGLSIGFYLWGIEYPKYVELQEDVIISDIGEIKRGTILKVDEEMSEGFTRYILYLNNKGIGMSEYKQDKEKVNLIIPYWLAKSEWLLSDTFSSKDSISHSK